MGNSTHISTHHVYPPNLKKIQLRAIAGAMVHGFIY